MVWGDGSLISGHADPTCVNCPMEFCQAPVPKPSNAQDDNGWGRLRSCAQRVRVSECPTTYRRTLVWSINSASAAFWSCRFHAFLNLRARLKLSSPTKVLGLDFLYIAISTSVRNDDIMHTLVDVCDCPKCTHRLNTIIWPFDCYLRVSSER